MEKLVSKEIAQAMDLLEQIYAVNQMIELHQESGDDLMLKQYKYRKSLFVKELGILLAKFNISPKDLAA